MPRTKDRSMSTELMINSLVQENEELKEQVKILRETIEMDNRTINNIMDNLKVKNESLDRLTDRLLKICSRDNI